MALRRHGTTPKQRTVEKVERMTPTATRSTPAEAVQLDGAAWHQPRSALTDDEIRVRAYSLWEEAGRPLGDGVQFWLAAENELNEVG